MGFILKDFGVTNGTKEKFSFLMENLACVKSQRHLDAIDNIYKCYKRYKDITEEQGLYLDIIINIIKRCKDKNA